MDLYLEDLVIEDEFSIGDLEIDVIELKGNQVDLIVTPTYEEQVFYPPYATSFGKVTVEAMESLDDVIDEQDEVLETLKTSIDGLQNAVKLEELNVEPKQVEQEFVAGDGRGYDKVKVGKYTDYLRNSIDYNAEPYEYEIPEDVTRLFQYAFESDNNLQKITANCPNMLTFYGFEFYNCKGLKEAYLPYVEGLISGGRDFVGCTSLVKLYMPRLKGTANSVFASCSALKYTRFDSMTAAGSTNGFVDCSSLVTLYLPELTQFGGTDTTRGMTALKDIIIGTSNCTLKTLNNSNVMADANARYYVKPEYVETYKVATNWVTYADKIVGYEEQTIKKGDIVSLTGGNSYELSIFWYDTVEECATLDGNTLTAVDTGDLLVRVLDANGSVTNGIVYHIEEA